jgi:hypothetical protein
MMHRVLARPALIALFSSIGLYGCPQYLFEEKFPSTIHERHVVQPAATPTPADILFVIDDSCSMDNKQENLNTNINNFINALVGGGTPTDYRIAVATTDLEFAGGERGGQSKATYEMSTWNYLSGLDVQSNCKSVGIDHGCFRGDDPTQRIIKTKDMDAQTAINQFRSNAAVGSCGSGIETGINGAITALQKASSGGCNDGFLRNDANLVIIVLSDEDDTDNHPLADYVNQLAAIKDPAKTRIAMITASEDGKAASCSIAQGDQCGKTSCGQMPPCNGATDSRCTDWMTWCNFCSLFNTGDCCTAIKNNHPLLGEGGRYVSFAIAMEQRITAADTSLKVTNCRPAMGEQAACLVDSICQMSYGETLTKIASQLVVSNCYSLDPAPCYAPGTAVHLTGSRWGDGVDLQYGTDFSVSMGGQPQMCITNAKYTPAPGDTVNIYYLEGGSC